MKKLVLLCAWIMSLLLISCGGGDGSNSSSNGTLEVVGTGSAAAGKPLFARMDAPNFGMMPAGSPDSLNVSLYKLWLVPGASCTGTPVLADDNGSTPGTVDFIANPSLFSGSVPAGTYNCVVIKLNDVMTFSPDAAAEANAGAACTASSSYDFDIFKVETPTNESWYDFESGTTIAGDGTPTAPAAQPVYVFISTDPAALLASNSSIHSHQTITLGAPLTITAGQTKTVNFIMDFSDRISILNDGTDHCWLEPAYFAFQ